MLKINTENTFIISDLHFGHNNIIRYCDRPYSSVEEMNSALIENWNNTVSEDSIVFFLGDFSMRTNQYGILNSLKFGKIYWIVGNHDREKKLLKAIEKFELNIEVFRNLTIEVGDKQFYLVHNPMKASNELPSIVGHVHNLYGFLPAGSEISDIKRVNNERIKTTKTLAQPILNVSVERIGYTPLELAEAIKFFD